MSANYCSEEYLEVVNGVRATLFVFSFLACLLVIVAWIFSACSNPNKERWTESSLFYTADRLPFYLLVVAAVHSFFSIFQLASLGHDKNNSTIRLCTSVAFFSTWLETSMLLISIIAPAHLMLINCKKVSNWLQDERKRRPRILEVGYIVTATIGSLTAALIPFLCLPFGVSCYGYDPMGQWCWIRGKDENCTRIPAGWAMEIVLFFLPTFVAFFLILVVLGHIFIIYYKERCPAFVLRLLPDMCDQGFTRPMIALTSCLFLFSLFNVISFGIRVDQITSKADAIVLSINHSLWGLIPSFAVGVLLLCERRKEREVRYEEFVSPTESIQDL